MLLEENLFVCRRITIVQLRPVPGRFRHVLLFATLWTIICQLSRSMGFPQARIIEWKEQDGGGVGGHGVHLSPQIHEEYTFRHRSGCRTSAESRQEYLTSGKEYIEPRKTWDQALSLWSGSTDSKTLDYHRTNTREYLTNSKNSHKGNHLNARPGITQTPGAPCAGHLI